VGAAGLRLGRPARRDTPTGWLGKGAPGPVSPFDEPQILTGPHHDDPDPPVSEPAPISIIDRAREMRALFDAQNHSSALVLAESVLTSDPSHEEAQRCAAACRAVLADKYLGRLGGPRVIPRPTMTPEEVCALALDHRAGFLLSFIDGCMSIEEVLDVSSMPALEALRIMYELREQGAIEIVVPGRRPGRR